MAILSARFEAPTLHRLLDSLLEPHILLGHGGDLDGLHNPILIDLRLEGDFTLHLRVISSRRIGGRLVVTKGFGRNQRVASHAVRQEEKEREGAAASSEQAVRLRRFSLETPIHDPAP